MTRDDVSSPTMLARVIGSAFPDSPLRPLRLLLEGLPKVGKTVANFLAC